MLSIHDAATRGKVFRVAECLSRERADVDAVNEDGVTPLHLAVRAGHVKVVKASDPLPCNNLERERATETDR